MPYHRRRIPVRIDRREFPRLDFRCPVLINGVPGVKQLADISLGGVFIDVPTAGAFHIDQELQLKLRLPTETRPTEVKAKVSYLGANGIGCMFIDPGDDEVRQIRRCFETFKDTLPID